MILKRFGILASSLILGGVILVGCSDTKNIAPGDTDTDIEDVAGKGEDDVGKDVGNGEEAVPQTTEELLSKYDEATKKDILSNYSKDSYDLSLYVDSKDKLEFYKTKEIFSGEEKTQAEDTYFVYYYSPGCVYCQEFYPTLVEYTEKENSYPIYKVNIDIVDNYTAFIDADIEGTPTLKLYDKKEDKFKTTLVGVKPLESLPVILE